jgi:hypothetical protein
LIWGRKPTPDQAAVAAEFLDGYRAQLAARSIPSDERTLALWAAYARVLLASNEFLFVD